ncbi:adenosylcobinamide-phosphate synthase CbiB [Myxacorys almedinensis]|uniref:Cobalamin biosynthesis protein CobD n=1 Tax=Myxacorys almedinensis A TaxID=2690445 RepID=A0A8J8CP69_9CYAN|nr:adenosylcobinamide-phosphate synthase CbiB [Myxacorys almedinensis]NDJ19157.1 cobalamin biosynthesis protein [Myxacorys almedinensis A]
MNSPELILIGAAVLDYLIGDPRGWLHPVQVMGWCITGYLKVVLRGINHPTLLKLTGTGFAIALIVGSSAIAQLIIAMARSLHPIFGILVAVILLASCFAGRSLRNAATDVLEPLAAGNLAEARSRLQLYVGRDTQTLSEPEILRAVFETVSENAVDGVTAPLFYALLGALLPAGSVGLAIAYKASSTLDSMIGYRTAPYAEIGWFSAKIDDLLTWLPCRLTVVTLALLSGKPAHVWALCRRDAPHDPSPNSGWSECVYAAALDVQVGGVNHYGGIEKQKPFLGEALRPITAERVWAALRLTRWCVSIWLGIWGVGYGIWKTAHYLIN